MQDVQAQADTSNAAAGQPAELNRRAVLKSGGSFAAAVATLASMPGGAQAATGKKRISFISWPTMSAGRTSAFAARTSAPRT